ncbi:uncharacterized protein LOC9648105 [Selaginella moellendorffii]|uniref:uncharacterized protein LOC9648105 n=1 Tax=Selaginella moellendorffii TaxID=88036 RepID=UPI000D1CD71A|nr:uncharacterized protein LOC9648105 [Selaginella moellendorffii]|eukprot:XP_002980331.2 uncharacterized protein LOC9648105 [Selaginella moellendorffii]
MPPVQRFAIAIALALLIVARVDAQVARKENIKYLRCAVCEQISKQLFEKVSEKKSIKKKLSEFEIIELAENICNVKKRESEWMFFLDIVREGNKLKLVEQPEEGECNTKCRTIERTCQEVIGDHDTDIAEFIHTHLRDLSEEAIFKSLCKEVTKSCSSKLPALPKTLDLGEPFTPKPTKDADMARLMRSMGDMPGGQGMKMYSKDDLMNMNNYPGGDPDDDDDDDDTDEGSKLQSLLKKQNLKNPANPKNQPKRSMLTQVLDHVQSIGRDTLSSARKTKDKVTKYVKRWWRRAKSSKQRQAQKVDL